MNNELGNALTTYAVAYMYLGWAIRSCLATGMNRETPNANARTCMSMSRIWWLVKPILSLIFLTCADTIVNTGAFTRWKCPYFSFTSRKLLDHGLTDH